jgi:putative SOS response-associated peptidase YedK
MCGRYALALRPPDVRRQLQADNMPMQEEDVPEDDYRQTYNFAPGYYGLVYRADVPDPYLDQQRQHHDASEDVAETEQAHDAEDVPSEVEPEVTSPPPSCSKPTDTSSELTTSPKYKLQPMRWGLIPFWTKRAPDYSSTMRTINCRDDSLSTSGGMWNTMKQNKRCIVLAQGFYEWLKNPHNAKDKTPHYTKRKDGKLMCFAGLYDRVIYEDGKEVYGKGSKEHPLYTYTVITTDSNKQLNFLHDRMPVILEPGSPEMFLWLDNGGHSSWAPELQALLKPYDGELECYPVVKDVGKVGNNSPTFIVPVDSKDNKQNIANFFGGAKKAAKSEEAKKEVVKEEQEVEKKGAKVEHEDDAPKQTVMEEEVNEESNAPVPASPSVGIKREHEKDDDEVVKAEEAHSDKKPKMSSPIKSTASPTKVNSNINKRSRDATSNHTLERAAAKKAGAVKASDGSKKITSFFEK